MLSIDTNLLFYAFATDRAEHAAAREWITPLHESDDVVLSEFMLTEFYPRCVAQDAFSRKFLKKILKKNY